MYNVVKIGDKEVPMLSMASVDFYYKEIFHEDPIKLQVENSDAGAIFTMIEKMGFVMAKFAEIHDRKEMLKLNMDSFYEWLDGFERNDLTDALEDIQKTYEGQTVTSSKAKKKKDEPTDL